MSGKVADKVFIDRQELLPLVLLVEKLLLLMMHGRIIMM